MSRTLNTDGGHNKKKVYVMKSIPTCKMPSVVGKESTSERTSGSMDHSSYEKRKDGEELE